MSLKYREQCNGQQHAVGRARGRRNSPVNAKADRPRELKSIVRPGHRFTSGPEHLEWVIYATIMFWYFVSGDAVRFAKALSARWMIGVMLSARSTMAIKNAGNIMSHYTDYDPRIFSWFCAGRLGQQ